MDHRQKDNEMMKLATMSAVAAVTAVLASPVMAQPFHWRAGGSQSGQAESEFGGQQDARRYSSRNHVERYAYGNVGPTYGYGYPVHAYGYPMRRGFWPGDVAAGIVAGAIGTAGAVASAPFRDTGSYASMDEEARMVAD